MAAHELPPETPTTDQQLFDRLHEMFGMGEWDPDGDVPWWKVRAVETAKVKRSRAKHGASLAELYVAALYARAHGIDVKAVTWLYRHIADAWNWWDERTRRHRQAEADHAWEAAVSAETDPVWRDRLIRAAPETRQEVLAEWRSTRRT